MRRVVAAMALSVLLAPHARGLVEEKGEFAGPDLEKKEIDAGWIVRTARR